MDIIYAIFTWHMQSAKSTKTMKYESENNCVHNRSQLTNSSRPPTPPCKNVIIPTYSSQSPQESFWFVFACSRLYLLWMKVNVRSDMKGVWLVCASPVFLHVVWVLCLFVSHRIAKGSAAYSWAQACCKIPSKYLIFFLSVFKGENNTWNKCNIENAANYDADKSPWKTHVDI